MHTNKMRPPSQRPSCLPKQSTVIRRFLYLGGTLANDASRQACILRPDRVHRYACDVLRFAGCPRTQDNQDLKQAIVTFTSCLFDWVQTHELVSELIIGDLESLVGCIEEWSREDMPEPAPEEEPALNEDGNDPASIPSRKARQAFRGWLAYSPHSEEVMRRVLWRHFNTATTKDLNVRQLRDLRSLIHKHGARISSQIDEERHNELERLMKKGEGVGFLDLSAAFS